MRHPLPLALGRGLVALALVGLSAAPVAASRPSCVIENTRNHRDFATLQAAHDAAKANDTLTVRGTCVGTTLLIRSLTITGITSRHYPDAPTLDGDAAENHHVLAATGEITVAVNNLIITNGSTSGDGGGIHSDGATLTVNDSVITGNIGGLGGGMSVSGGSVTVNNSTISSNSAYVGGGIVINSGTVTLNDSTVTSNTAVLLGGGIAVFEGALYLNNSTVTGNQPDNCFGTVAC